MLNGASQIVIDTAGWNQKFVKIATIKTQNGAITDIKQWKMDAIGGEIGGWGGFKNVSNCKYKSGLLVQFLADGELVDLEYSLGRLSKVIVGEKTYTITYKFGKFFSLIES